MSLSTSVLSSLSSRGAAHISGSCNFPAFVSAWGTWVL